MADRPGLIAYMQQWSDGVHDTGPLPRDFSREFAVNTTHTTWSTRSQRRYTHYTKTINTSTVTSQQVRSETILCWGKWVNQSINQSKYIGAMLEFSSHACKVVIPC